MIPLSPALMLFSPTWRRVLPQTIPMLVRLLPRDSRIVLHDLMALHLAWEATQLYWEQHMALPIVVHINKGNHD